MPPTSKVKTSSSINAIGGASNSLLLGGNHDNIMMRSNNMNHNVTNNDATLRQEFATRTSK